jgi:hypothetical protein
MHDRQRSRNRKWLILGTAGFAGGLVTLLIFRSLPMATGTAAATIVALIVLKHLALAVAVASPLFALLQRVKPTLRAYCPWGPEDDR